MDNEPHYSGTDAMRVVVETLIVFIVMFKHGERIINRSGVLAARRFGDVVKYPPEVIDKLHAFSCKDIEWILNYQFRERIFPISLPTQTSCMGTNLPSKKLLKLVCLRLFAVFYGSFSTIMFLRMSSMAELWLESL